jgi:hypothetical protein
MDGWIRFFRKEMDGWMDVWTEYCAGIRVLCRNTAVVWKIMVRCSAQFFEIASFVFTPFQIAFSDGWVVGWVGGGAGGNNFS